MEQQFERDIQSLGDIFDFLSRFVAERKLGDGVVNPLNLAVEELFTNMVKYNTGSSRPIEIQIDEGYGGVWVQLVDSDVDPFDPSTVDEPDVHKGLDERSPGGLGLHLVKSVVDKVTYEYSNRQMTVTVVKRLEQ